MVERWAVNPATRVRIWVPPELCSKNKDFFLIIEDKDYSKSKSRTKIGVSVDTVKKQKALEPKTSKKTKSSRAKNAVFGIHKTSNQNIKEGEKKAYNYEKVFVTLIITLFS